MHGTSSKYMYTVSSGDKAAVFSDEKRSQSLGAAFTQQQSKSGTLKPRINGEKQHICVRMGLQIYTMQLTMAEEPFLE